MASADPTGTPAQRIGAGAAGAGIAALIAAGGTVALGMLVAALFPDESLIGQVGVDTALPVEGFRQVLQFLLIGMLDAAGIAALDDSDTERASPALLAAVPLGLSALVAAGQAHRTRGIAAWKRTLWGAAIGIPFALLMLVCAVAAGNDEDVRPSIGAAFVAGLAWSALGGALGAAWRARADRPREGPARNAGRPAQNAGRPAQDAGRPGRSRPAALTATLDVLGRSLRPLAVLLVVGTLVGTVAWVARTLLPPVGAVPDRPVLLGTIENALYAVEHGIHFGQLGAFVQFEPPGADLDMEDLPFPPDVPEDVAASNDRYRLLAYRDALPPYFAVPLLVVAFGLVLVSVTYAGFSTARGRRARSAALGAAWGTVVGPVWAIVMSLANALVDKPVFGQAVGDSVLASFLLVGSLLGALGGALAGGRPSRARAEGPRASPPPT